MSAYARRRAVAKATGFPDEVAQVDDQLGTVHQVGPVQRQGTGQLLGLGEQLQRRALLELRVLVDVRQLAVVGQQGAGLRVREIHTESEVVQRRVCGGPVGVAPHLVGGLVQQRSEEHTSELQSLMRTSYAVFCLKKKQNISNHTLKTCTTL